MNHVNTCLICIFAISILAILSGCLMDDKIDLNKINNTKDRIKELNDRSTLYNENGWVLFRSGTSRLSLKGSIPENIALLEVSLEPLMKAEDYFKEGYQTQLEIYNLTWDLSQMNAINDSEFKRNKKIVEINLRYYKSMIEGVQYEIKAHNEFLAGYRLIKNDPSDEAKILNFISSILVNKPDFSQLVDSKYSIDAQIRFKKGGEYLKYSIDSIFIYALQRNSKELLEERLGELCCVYCEPGIMGKATAYVGLSTTGYEYYCVMEECDNIKQKDSLTWNDNEKEFLDNSKEIIIYASSIYPPRTINIT